MIDYRRAFYVTLMAIIVILTLTLTSQAATAETVKLRFSGTTGAHKLSGAQPDGSQITFSVFCLDYDRPTPTGELTYRWEHGGEAAGMEAALLARAAWIMRADDSLGSSIDKQFAIWALSSAAVTLTPQQHRLVALSATNFDILTSVDLLLPVGSDSQRYLVAGVMSSMPPAEIPEPLTLTTLGLGLALVGRRLRKRV